MSRRNWKISRRGDHYRTTPHGSVRILLEDGIIVSRTVSVRPMDTRQAQEFDEQSRRMNQTIAQSLPVFDFESRIRNLRIRT